MPLVQEVTVIKNAWISPDQFADMIGLAECTPGPIALNMATYVGATQAGFLGGLCATLGVVLPSFIIICIIAALLAKVSNNIYVNSTLKGASFVAIGLIGSIALTMFLSFTSNFNFSNFQINYKGVITLAISAVCYLILWLYKGKKPGPLPTIGLSVLVGLFIGYLIH